MDITAFNAKFQQSPEFRTQVLAGFAAEAKKSGLNSALDIATDDAGGLKHFVFDKDGKDPTAQLAAANAAITVLKLNGVSDFTGIKAFDPKIDPLAWNVVYKDGGWILNGLQGPDMLDNKNQL